MRRTSARIAQLRNHLRRRRHDVQAQAAFDALLLAKPDRARTALDDVLARYYDTGSHMRQLRRSLNRSTYRDLVKTDAPVGLVAWIPATKTEAV